MLALVVTWLVGCSKSAHVAPERIVLIVVDTLRRDHLSVYGGAWNTPNTAALARTGVAFENVLASFHQTTMSMGALFTGRTPSIESSDPTTPVDWIEPNWCGMARFAAVGDERCLPLSVPTLAEVLRARGYWTAGVVSNRLLFRPSGFERGFDRWVEVEAQLEPGDRYKLRLVAEGRSGERVNQAVRQVLAERASDRFFLYVHYMDVHDWEQRGMSYGQSVEYVDRCIGDLTRELEKLGLLEGTAIVFTADHGESLGEKHLLPTAPYHFGNPTFEEILRIPLIVAGSDLRDDGRVVRSQDLFGLIAATAGASTDEPERDLAPGELLLTERAFRTYRYGRWKSFVARADGSEHLVDLESDPGETRDAAATHADVVARNRTRIEELSKRLTTRSPTERALSEREADALRALGYLAPAE